MSTTPTSARLRRAAEGCDLDERLDRVRRRHRAGNFGLAVLTYEKVTGLLVEHPQLLDRCSVVVDEVQMLGDGGRGANLEKALTQVLLHKQAPQIVASSSGMRSEPRGSSDLAARNSPHPHLTAIASMWRREPT
jgi:superfamily II helicase